jgi:hypothetical protein
MLEGFYTKKEFESLLLKTLGRSPKLRMIDFFMENPLSRFTKREARQGLGMDKQKFYEHLEDLEKLRVVKFSRRGRAVDSTWMETCWNIAKRQG